MRARFFICWIALLVAGAQRGAGFDPWDIEDRAEFVRRSRMNARDLAAEAHGDVRKAAQYYLRQLDSADAEKRGEALGDLISLGLDEYLPRIHEAMRAADASTLKAAESGMRETIKGKYASKTFRAELCDALIETIPRYRDRTRMGIALQLDREKPVGTILKQEAWAKDAPGLQELLYLLRDTRARVPLEKLRELASGLPNGNDRDAWWTYAAFLECYGLVAPKEAEPLILKALKNHPFPKVENDVDWHLANALCTARGVVDPYETILPRYFEVGFGKLSKVERTYTALMFFYLAGEMAGYATFFENHADEAWNDLRAGMVELKKTNYVKMLDAMAAVFTGKKPGQPGFNFEAEEDGYYRRTGKELKEELDRVSDEHHFKADLSRLIPLWAADHADEFKAAWNAVR